MMITVEERFMNSDRVGRKGVSFVSVSEMFLFQKNKFLKQKQRSNAKWLLSS